jgi:hypothetical protein
MQTNRLVNTARLESDGRESYDRKRRILRDSPPPNCPKCGKPLNVYRLLHFAIYRQEPFEFYLCYEHGFFLHDQRRTKAGL